MLSDGRLILAEVEHKFPDGGVKDIHSVVAPSSSCRTVERLWNQVRSSLVSGELDYIGLDAPYTEVRLRFEKRSWRFRSWHRLMEEDSRLVAASYGLAPIPEGKTRDEVLRLDSDSYRTFRASFDALYQIVRSNGTEPKKTP